MRVPNSGMVRRVLTNAFQVWSHNSKLNFREVYSRDADLQIVFARLVFFLSTYILNCLLNKKYGEVSI